MQNQDFTVIEDYVSGLKTALYLGSCEATRNWNMQSPPTAKHQKGKPVVVIPGLENRRLPNFGPYMAEKQATLAAQKVKERESNSLSQHRSSKSDSRNIIQPSGPVLRLKVTTKENGTYLLLYQRLTPSFGIHLLEVYLTQRFLVTNE